MNFTDIAALAFLPLALAIGLGCVTLICLVALLRARRDDVVPVLGALPAVISAVLRRKR
ncbi:hypothetical protein [Streptomyces sp. NBC_00102]|uniref:hypothetical protein n=1 Tax=Streptomyces sp. NBC_00102 TaxID=2975652 RepID=UPI002258DEE0|nr:hypothetical protein [Streptomyces sp. NBC_00102]MCX5398161.1 hypothetical protein [Streptomyces sp. NBC_00102]